MMEFEKREPLRMFLKLDNGEVVELLPFDELPEAVIKGGGNDKPDAMEERRAEMVREAHEQCFEKISEAQEYCEGYIDGVNKMFDVCRDIMRGSGGQA